MADKRERYDGEHSEEHGLPPGELENDPAVHHADPAAATGELSERSGDAALNPAAIEPDSGARNEIADQMEEFEGPDRREIRGGPHQEPAKDPGVAHS